MTIEQLILEQEQENREIVEALLEDGSQPDADYVIEHHFSGSNFDKLEKAAVDAFKAGFEVEDAEELELDDGAIVFAFDAVAEHKLEVERLNKDTKAMIELADKHGIQYDGWGTYFVE
ncbi:ribonuclease E inhibitor RraB [Ferrimonas sediminicola]|uniref:Regulator of ribonuclease activity B n=1 Tax=Ferrimonas sediminicola TaxID=2569538 RepID=A0A4U1BIW8_9GAMM|nr:ribonuclease E inhibitor RraB [Ferrimonas sediminicola]TKB51420.1 ribonuclease E inhibitor RraB [Ferrimonas sediminicola]